MVRGYYQQIGVVDNREYLRKPFIKVFKPFREVLGVVSVPPKHIEINKVEQHQADEALQTK